ncbi:putative caffeoyl-CoA O-methyltransferase [Dirofilaria immitis]
MKWLISVLIILSNIFVIIFASLVPWRSDNIHEYCVNISIKMDPIQRTIIKRTLENVRGGMMIAAPEVLQLGQTLIHLIKAKKAIDIGTFTGSSAVAWALAMPNNSEVLTIDIYAESYNQVSRELINTRPDIYPKIKRHVGPAAEKLDTMIASGEAGKWDFVFIDADKINYPLYYEQSIKLLRPGGIIVIDNALWGGSVVKRDRLEKDRKVHEMKFKND